MTAGCHLRRTWATLWLGGWERALPSQKPLYFIRRQVAGWSGDNALNVIKETKLLLSQVG